MSPFLSHRKAHEKRSAAPALRFLSVPSVAGSVAGCNFHSLTIPSTLSSSTRLALLSFHPCNALSLPAPILFPLLRSIAVQLLNSAIQTCGQLNFQNSWFAVPFLQVSKHAICHGGRRLRVVGWLDSLVSSCPLPIAGREMGRCTLENFKNPEKFGKYFQRFSEAGPRYEGKYVQLAS